MVTNCGIRKFKFYFMLMNVLILCSITVYQNNIDKRIFGIVKTYVPSFKKLNQVTTLIKPSIEEKCKLTFTNPSMKKTNNLTVAKHTKLTNNKFSPPHHEIKSV